MDSTPSWSSFMNARYLPATTALTTVAVLLLAAGGCAKDSSTGSGEEKIAGPEQSSKAPTPGASAPAPGGTERPKITLPGTFRMDFEGWTNSDRKLQAILSDGGEELRSKHAAIIEGDPESDAVAFYNSGASLDSARKWIKSFVDDDNSLIGGVRVFAPQVHINESGSGVLFYCVDERKASTKNRKTGEITATPDNADSVLQYRARLDRTSQGVWKTVSLETVPGACG
ncbi:hypothetical protein [Streptomyces sp. A5-4]|uniref:hypothetical protein n=1 Tax=Streptomyces sp. A5-4 TaxID=3384771 RepID=UPI003DA8195C